MAEENKVMTMKNWIDETDDLLKFRKKEISTSNVDNALWHERYCH